MRPTAAVGRGDDKCRLLIDRYSERPPLPSGGGGGWSARFGAPPAEGRVGLGFGNIFTFSHFRAGVFFATLIRVMELSSDTFVCQRCGACCRVPGYVRLTDKDVDALAAALGLSVAAFIEAYTELSPTRSGLVLKGDTNAPCRFLTEDNLCQVHVARPQQCRDYPERWRSAEIEAVCLAERRRSQSDAFAKE